MDISKIFELVCYTLPAIVTGLVAYNLFNSYFKDQQNTRKWLLQKDSQKETLSLRLQAYERMTLFSERINLGKLVVRISPISTNKNDYANYLADHIEQEFEHNLTQQLYISSDCWALLKNTKDSTILLIRSLAMDEKAQDANAFREMILSNGLEKDSPSYVALAFIKTEVSMLW